MARALPTRQGVVCILYYYNATHCMLSYDTLFYYVMFCTLTSQPGRPLSLSQPLRASMTKPILPDALYKSAALHAVRYSPLLHFFVYLVLYFVILNDMISHYFRLYDIIVYYILFYCSKRVPSSGFSPLWRHGRLGSLRGSGR